MKMYVCEFYSNGVNDLRPRIDYTRYEGYGLVDSVDGELKEGDVLYFGATSNSGMTAVSKDLNWVKRNSFHSNKIQKVVYKENSFLPYEEVI